MIQEVKRLFRYDELNDECKNAFVTSLKIMPQ